MFAGGPLMPWQRRVVDVACEKLEDGSYAYDEVVIVVGRRAGKTRLSHGVPLRRGIAALAAPVHHPLTGRRVPYLAASTAQNMTAAGRRLKETWDAYRMAAGPRAEERSRLLRGVNHSAIELDYRRRVATPTGGQRWDVNPFASRLSVFAPSASSVRGDEFLLLSIDEVLTLSLADGQELLEAASPTLTTFHGMAQMWWLSNEAKQSGGWLHHLKRRGRAAVDAGERTGTAYFEWSMRDDDDPLDPAVWHASHPALGEILTEAALSRELDKLGVDSFAREYLGLPAPARATTDAAVNLDMWDAAGKSWHGIPPVPTLWLAVDQDPERAIAVVTVSAQLPDGTILLDVAAVVQHPREPALVDLLAKIVRAQPEVATIAFDPRTCASLGAALTAAGLPAEAVPAGERHVAAYADLTAALRDGRLKHSADSLLREHMAAAIRRPYGDGGYTLSRRSSGVPISGAVSAALAVHLAARPVSAFFAF